MERKYVGKLIWSLFMLFVFVYWPYQLFKTKTMTGDKITLYPNRLSKVDDRIFTLESSEAVWAEISNSNETFWVSWHPANSDYDGWTKPVASNAIYKTVKVNETCCDCACEKKVFDGSNIQRMIQPGEAFLLKYTYGLYPTTISFSQPMMLKETHIPFDSMANTFLICVCLGVVWIIGMLDWNAGH